MGRAVEAFLLLFTRYAHGCSARTILQTSLKHMTTVLVEGVGRNRSMG